jgi:TP901 family phage tail tape measure protein
MAIFIPLVTKFDPKGLQGAQRALANFQNFAVDVGRVAATAIAAVGVASVREAAQFETSFAKIQGLVGVTADEIGELEDAARRLGPSFGISANEAAEALFFITSAGLRGESAIEVLEASLKGAAIGLGETKVIADLATSAVNAYGEANLGGAEAVDVLAEAVRLGKLEPAELAAAMGQVLPLASNLGVTFDEVGAAMAGMSKTGTDASTAAVQLRQIMATLAKPTVEADRALAEMGLSAEGLREQIREKGLFSTLETLTDAFDGNIEATTEVFGNIRALSGVLDLMGASVDDNRELFRLMADDIKVTDEALGIVQDTAQNKFAVAMETARDSLLEIGLAILDMVSPHLDTFSKWMDENGPAIEEGFIKIYDAINKFLTSEVLAEIIQKFKDMWPEIEEAVYQLGELVGILAPVLLDAVNDLLPSLGDLASIMDDLGFFTGEVLTLFGEWEGETPNIVEFLNKQLNPIERLKESIAALRDVLNAMLEAYDRFRSVGFELR